jgi:hypothetical protein
MPPRTDPRLGRKVNHDPRSRAYPYLAPRRALRTVEHPRHIPILDQGDLGSCTGNAAVGALGSGRLWDGLLLADRPRLDEAMARQLYSEATKLDPFPGSWPPDDTGSDGLSVAKACQRAGFIGAYRHAFSLTDFLAALQQQPVIVGTTWYQSMFTPSTAGLLTVEVSSGAAGGHEYVARRYDATNSLIGFDNSWGTSWGAAGSFWIRVADFQLLLAEQGDATVFTPLAPAPSPAPPPPNADEVLWADPDVQAWLARRHIGTGQRTANALRRWRTSKLAGR